MFRMSTRNERDVSETPDLNTANALPASVIHDGQVFDARQLRGRRRHLDRAEGGTAVRVRQRQHPASIGNHGWESVPRRMTQRRTDEHWLHRTSSALKHFFDTVYYPVMDDTEGRP
jgi:uncharacterized protein (UPF0218 family)